MTMPYELRQGPFTVAEAKKLGLTWSQLQAAEYQRLTRGIYAWSKLTTNPPLMFRAVMRRLPAEAIFSGRSAAWLHGIDVAACSPVQVTLPSGVPVSGRAGIWVRRSPVLPAHIVIRCGFRATNVLRTLLDIGQTLPAIEAVVIADQILHNGLIDVATLTAAVAARAGTWNVKRLRRLLERVEPKSESPMESRLRMILVLGGLPRPEAQVDLRDRTGRPLGRADLYYPSHRLAIEYDGGSHRDSLVRDNRRQNAILAAGFRILRFTGPDVRDRPQAVVALVRAELSVSLAA